MVAGALIAGAIYYGDKTSSGKPTPSQDPGKIELAPVAGGDHILNGGGAQIFIVEYSDTECPFCKVFHNTMKDVLSAYGTEVAWVYRHLPIPQLHQRAMSEAIATECIADLAGNTAFWTYLDKIFTTTNSNDSLDPVNLTKFATEAGVNLQAFEACRKDPKIEERINKSVEDGYKAGARGTPYSLIVDKDGKVLDTINGAEPLQNIKVKLDAHL